MNQYNGDKDGPLEKLQEDLYKKDFKQPEHQRHNLDQKDYELESDWEEPQQEEQKPVDLSELSEEGKKKMGFFGWVMVFAAIFFIASISYAAYVFYGGNQTISANDVDINIVGPVSIAAGEVLSLDLIIQNNNPVPLQAVDLIVEYPEGTRSAENLIDNLSRTRERVDDIEPGTLLRKTISSALFGDEGDNKEISITAEYQVPGSNAIFKKQKMFSVILNAAPARITVSGLEEISSGQEVELEAVITSNSNTEIKNLMVTASYPFGFEFIESDVDPTYSNNVWVFESIAPKEKKTIKIKGTITGQNEEERVFRFNTGLISEENEREIGVIFNNYIHDLTVKRPFVGLDIYMNGSNNSIVTANSGSAIPASIVFTNNTNDLIKDLSIRLELEGEVLNESRISSNQGFYRSSDNTILFNTETNPKLAQIFARDEITSSFRFEVKNIIGEKINIKNPNVKLTAFVEGQRISGENIEEEINESIVKTLRVISDVFVGSYTLRDLGPFANSGPIPPAAEQETTYTITWSVSNNSNDLRDARITAFVPNYVNWKNKVSPSNETYVYDENSKQITWNLGNVSAGVGNTTSARELSFQVGLFPSLSQVGQAPNLLRDIVFSAEDTFTETEIRIAGTPPTTKINGVSNANRHDLVVE
jgi:hypothetical protein